MSAQKIRSVLLGLIVSAGFGMAPTADAGICLYNCDVPTCQWFHIFHTWVCVY
jgi:hypothetical protein